MHFPHPSDWSAVSRDATIKVIAGEQKIRFQGGPLSNAYALRFDTLIGDQVVPVTTANKAILLHKAALFADEKAFEQLLSAKQTKKMLSIASSIKNIDEQAWKAAEPGIVQQVLHEKFLTDLWMFDTLCLTSNYAFEEAPAFDLVTAPAVTCAALATIRATVRPASHLIRPLLPPCHVVNKHFATADIDISRGTCFGNEHPITDDEPRDVVIAKYKTGLKEKLRRNEITREQLLSLHGKRLGCTCMPNACHGDVLTEAVKWVASTVFNEEN